MKHKPLDFEDILSDHRSEEEFYEVPLQGRVFKLSFFLALGAAALLFGGLFVTNIIEGDAYEARATRNISDEQIEEAPRGVVLDRFGNPLVHNDPSLKVVLSPRDFPAGSAERLDILSRTSKALNIPRSELLEKIEERDWGQSDRLVIKENPSHDELVAIESIDVPGIYVEPSFVRIPEHRYAFSHVIGYTGLVGKKDIEEDESLGIDDKIGRAGLELYYDKELRGENGKSVFFRDAKGEAKERQSTKKAEQGNTLSTFIDRGLQEYAYERLSQGLRELGRDSGLVVAIDPRNGEVLALTNIPSYDVSDIPSALKDPKNPFFNRSVMGVYNPGSTIKPLHAVAALTEGVATPETSVYSSGVIEVPNPYNPSLPGRFLDWKAHGWVNVESALARSSNIFFYEVIGGFKNQKGIGIEKLNDWWRLFRMDQKTGIDLPGERVGFLPDPEWKEQEKNDPWRVGDTYNVAIGQGDFSITPMELINYIAAIANGGKFYSPRVVDAILDPEGNAVSRTAPEIKSDIGGKISAALPYVRRGMRDAVVKEYGTAHSLANLPVQVAAKTGTAQIQNNQKTNAFFVGYAPYDNPQIAVLVLVENAREGGGNALPIAKDIFMWYYENRLRTQ